MNLGATIYRTLYNPKTLNFYNSITLKIMEVKIINHSGHDLPAYQTAQSAGVDLRACLKESVVLHPMERKLIPTGLFIELPDGYEAQVRPWHYRCRLPWRNLCTADQPLPREFRNCQWRTHCPDGLCPLYCRNLCPYRGTLPNRKRHRRVWKHRKAVSSKKFPP